MKKLLYLILLIYLLPRPVQGQLITLKYDISLDHNNLRANIVDSLTGALVAGANFYIKGVIYPEGTFEDHGASSGLLADGTPQFPDEVIGTFWSNGWMIQPDNSTTGIKWLTKHIVKLEKEYQGIPPGQVVTSGNERAEFEREFVRAITGATDSLKSFTGEAVQNNLAINATGARNIGYKLVLKSLFDLSVETEAIEVLDPSVSFDLLPNPVQNLLKISIKNTGPPLEGNILVTNVTGRKVVNTNKQNYGVNTVVAVNVSNLTPGMYFVSLVLEGQKIFDTKKLIILK